MPALGGTTALLLLGVFAVVNIAVLVLRRDPWTTSTSGPDRVPVIGGRSCAFLVTPLTGRDPIQYQIAGVLLASGWCCGW